MLQQETERLRTDIDKMRNESKFVTSLLNSDQRLLLIKTGCVLLEPVSFAV